MRRCSKRSVYELAAKPARSTAWLMLALFASTLAWQAFDRQPAFADGLDCNAQQAATLAAFEVVPGRTLNRSIPEPLTEVAGDPAAGLEVFLNESAGNCIGCHEVASLATLAIAGDDAATARFGNQGTFGPALDAVAGRYTAGELRLIVVDPRLAWTDRRAAMPPGHAADAGLRVAAACAGQPILTAQQVEDVLAYLMTLQPAAQPATPEAQPVVPRP